MMVSSQSGTSEHVYANVFRTTTDGHVEISIETRVVSTQNESSEEIDQVWLSFLTWLKSDGSLFCVRGKPGSGKSTLMKFLVDNERTRELLQQDNIKPMILSHFFWKIGKSSQNTIKGLLCSLVHQILVGDDEMMDFVLDHDAMGSQRDFNDWSVTALTKVFDRIAEAKMDRLCIFIDGLDEVCNEDGIDNLMDMISEILKYPNVKICVSSRPEKTVTTWLERHTAPSIRLKDLTKPEMTTFALKELKPCLVSGKLSVETHRHLSQEVVEKSQEVFLWLYLVLRSLKAGIRNGDSEKMLLERLRELPSELEQLYADMWQRLNENHSVYRKTAAKYFQHAIHGLRATHFSSETDNLKTLYCTISQPTLGQIVCMSKPKLQDSLLSGGDSVDLTEVQQLCEETELDIEERCAGLLHLRPYRPWPPPHCPNSTAKLNKFFLEHVEFTHRTAHDFLTGTEAGAKIMAHATLSRDEIDVDLIRGFLCACNVLYSQCGMSASMTSVLHQISHIVERTELEKSQLTSNLLQIVQKLHADGAIKNGSCWKPKNQFLSCLTEFRPFHDYIVSTLKHSPSTTTATAVLKDSWGHDLFLDYRQEKLPPIHFIEALLSVGANPHIEVIDNKWRVSSDEPLVSNDSTFTHLLKCGGDVGTSE
ncbi:hypothetical protein ACHAP5_004209 [Fusarium lateritium]